MGELVNMVAGGAKAQLEQLDMSLTIPTVITGKFCVEFPSKTSPICVPFESPWGPLTVEVGLIEICEPVALAAVWKGRSSV